MVFLQNFLQNDKKKMNIAGETGTHYLSFKRFISALYCSSI